MSKLQFFTGYDDLKDYKLINGEMRNCIFFEHDINKPFRISLGTKNGNNYSEQIITDGIIKRKKYSQERPLIIWKEEPIYLDSGISLSLKLKDATFFVNIVSCNNESICEIHTSNESEELLKRILEYVYRDNHDLFDTNSISLQYPSTTIEHRCINGIEHIEKNNILRLNNKLK